MTRIASLLILAAIAVPASASGQIRPQFGVRGSVLPLYGGGGDVQMKSTWAGTIQGGFVMGARGHGEVEAFYTISPDNDAAPRMQMAGVMVGARGGPDAPVSIVVSLGAGMLDVGYDDRIGCGPPLCLREGGPTFREARLATIIGAFGVDVPLGGPTRLRFDARSHFPLGGDAVGNSDDIRLEIGVGIRALLK